MDFQTVMRPIPLKLKNTLAADPYYEQCARSGHDCQGPITWEHAFIYAGKQINEAWAIIPLCVYHHLGAGLNKRVNEYIALRNATEEQLAKYPRVNWKQLLDKLVMQDNVLWYNVIIQPVMAWEKNITINVV